ncbi:DNA polymerase III subunit alpha [Candidatus Peregrinibacteria bacterium]|nr:DNA polymerase III subunit alpha [Candidatus Peregrinibacteria bacterium]
MSFVNLHAHSHYSLLDGFGSPEGIVKRAKELGYPAAALTDHGAGYGLIEFYKAAKGAGIKPVLGSELYVATRTRFDKEAKVDVKPYHLTTLAENNEGYRNLLTLITKAHLEGFYYKPRVDYGLLKAYGKGLIVLSGCLAAHIPRAILTGNEEEIHRLVQSHIDIFGKENFFLEMQDHPLLEHQGIVNKKLKELAKHYGLGLVVTCDSHYAKPEDSDVHDILLCIQTQNSVNDENRMRYAGDFSIRDVKELKEVFSDCPEAIENTLKIAERCNVDFEFGNNLLPAFTTPNGEKSDEYLSHLCEEGLKSRFDGKEVPNEYWKRLEFELKTVHKMAFDTYFLIVHDFVDYAKRQKIVVGPGRGSAAGSILAWSLRITDLDPIKHGLFFERFLNPERISMPDIDIDFADTRRDEVLNYVINKYGRDNVAQIITFGTMAPRAAVRDVGRALGYPYAEVDKLAKTVPAPVLGKNISLAVSIEEDPAMKEVYKNDPRARALLDYAKRLEGTVRHAGTHACAVVISDHPLQEYTALQFGAGDSNEIVTQYSMKPIEELGLLKMDFLGLRNLTVIEKAEEIIKTTKNEAVDINKIPLDDTKTFELLQGADTTGVFQLESAGMKRYLKELKPTKFEDIVAMGALFRPGPMEWIPTYIRGKHKPESVQYLHPSFKTILEPTYGVAVYQEQILQIARDFAGFSLGEADILRKAVGKKIPSLLEKQREKFVQGSIKNGHKEKFAEEVFEKVIEPFAGYGFNKAHAACYGLIAYQTAYLKAHYPIEFMTALLCSDATTTDRMVLEIKECNEMGIDVLPPNVNESFTNFAIVDPKTIRFGLLAIKGIGAGAINEIIQAREKAGKFNSLEDFAKRVPTHFVNKKLLQALAYSGAFEGFGDRNQIAENYEEISKFAKYSQEIASNGQTDIFGALGDDAQKNCKLNFKDFPKSTNMQCLKWEKEFLGMYVSGHPLRGLKKYISKKAHLIGNLTKKNLEKPVKVLGLLTGLKKIVTKSGGYMATFTIEDPTGKVNAIMFPKNMAHYGSDLVEDQVVGINGKLDNRRGQYQVICDTVKLLSLDTIINNAKEQGFYNPDDKSDIAIRLLDDILADEVETYVIPIEKQFSSARMKNLKELLQNNQGDTPVELMLMDAKKRIKLPFGVALNDSLRNSINSLLV